MQFTFIVISTLIVLSQICLGSDVITLGHLLFTTLRILILRTFFLDIKNFEHLTQASTGATTGDWFIKFYAPWYLFQCLNLIFKVCLKLLE
jgi:hypothetical protein